MSAARGCGAHIVFGRQATATGGLDGSQLCAKLYNAAAEFAGIHPEPGDHMSFELSNGKPAERTNPLAIASLIVVFFSSLIGLILGHVALSQIKRSGDDGRGLALAAVIVGWTFTGVGIVIAVAAFVLVAVRQQ